MSKKLTPRSIAWRTRAIDCASLLPVPRPRRLLPPQPKPATLTLSPVRPSIVYSMQSLRNVGRASCRGGSTTTTGQVGLVRAQPSPAFSTPSRKSPLAPAAEKPKAPVARGFDESGFLRIVAKCQAQVADVLLDEPLRHAHIAPDAVEYAALGQQAVRIADEEPQQLEGLVADLNGLITMPQALIPENRA